ncbi:MAG TPA: ABC transporter permease [Acidimicrobiia bacterium]|nr:ABC transporter permease [Acidimicrobiia bacterium]
MIDDLVGNVDSYTVIAVQAPSRQQTSAAQAEATLLAALGGLLGVACGIGVSNLHMGKLHPVVSPRAVVLSFGVSALVGVFFGLYPASRAAKLRPIEALRFE